MKFTLKLLLPLILIISMVLSFASCDIVDSFIDDFLGDGANNGPQGSGPISEFDLSIVPKYTDNPIFIVNNNLPFFTDEQKVTESYEFYGELDELGRCTYTMACIGKDLMPTEEREGLDTKPTGWKNNRYDSSIVPGGWIYNRCHLIGFQLTGENDNERNLITGTRYLNIDGMVGFENMTADYIKETGNHVIYRVTPIFYEDNLLPSGVLMEAYSVEDEGEGICFNVFCYNVQPGIFLYYSTGDNCLLGNEGSAKDESGIGVSSSAKPPKDDTLLDPTNKPSDDPTTPPADDPTTPPADDPTTPPADDPTTPPADDPTTPPVDDPTTPPADDPTTPPADDPITPPADDPTDKPGTDLEDGFDISLVPEYSGNPYAVINGNVPYFEEDEITNESYEFYAELDTLGRCTYVMACLGIDLMPTEPRESLSHNPTGWINKSYSVVPGGWLYNRSHLIGFQLTGENNNEKNLITGTKFLNNYGMLPFENMIADALKEHNNANETLHIMYRVTPIFEGNNLVASGVLMEAYSVEDEGDTICFNVYCYNVQDGIIIDYKTGASEPLVPEVDEEENTNDGEKTTYVLNTNSKKVHKPDCRHVATMSEKNKEETDATEEELTSEGYTPCGTCKPFD